MWKVTGPDLMPHSCKEDLIKPERHTYAECPTQNINAHPQEKEEQRKKQNKDKKRKREEKKKKKERGMYITL